VTDLEILRQINEEAKNKPLKLHTERKGLHLGSVVRLPVKRHISKIEEYHLPYNVRGGHLGCFGTTGIGKSRFMSHMVYQDICAGLNVLLFDPKGDDALLPKVIQAAAETGRLDEVMYVSPIYPDASMKINPLTYFYMPDELVHHVVSGIRSEEEFFENIATNITSVVVTGLIALQTANNQPLKINLMDLKKKITHKDVNEFVEVLRGIQNHPDAKVRELVEDALTAVSHISQYPQEFFSKISASLGTVLAQLTSSTTGQIIGRTYRNEFIKRLEEGKRFILVLNAGSLLTAETARVIARMFMSTVQATIGRVLASGRTFDPPLSIYMDEGHSILYNGIEEMFSKGRSANVYLHFFTQSMSYMEDEVGEKTTQSIMDNINTWIFMRCNHEKTAKYIEDSSPLTMRMRTTVNMGGGSMSLISKEDEERVILKERVLRLKPRFFYLRVAGEYYSGRVPEVADPLIKLSYPKVSQAGNAVQTDEEEDVEALA